jgi:hypothetical protein
MLQDVMPGGVYGNTAVGSNSVFRVAVSPPYYTRESYFDAQGKPAFVYLPGDTTPHAPQSLSIDSFIAFFQPSWANSLLKYHPEYCRYQQCLADSVSHQYDNQMMEVGSYAEAFRKGFLNPLNSTAGTQLNEKPASIPANNNPDPYYQSGANGNYSTMLAFLNDITNTPSNPASLWHVAAKAYYNVTINAWRALWADTNNIGMKNLVWDVFRTIYLAQKNREQMMHYSACSSSSAIALDTNNIRFSIPQLSFDFQLLDSI